MSQTWAWADVQCRFLSLALVRCWINSYESKLTVWELKSWRVFWTHPTHVTDFLKLHGTSSELLLLHARTHTNTRTRTHTHTHTHTHAHTHRERAQKLHYKHLLPWMSLKVLSTFYYICEDILSSPMSSEVGFQHFTKIVKIFFSSPMSSKVVFQHCTVTVRVLCHECPQKLFFNIALYLWRYFILTNVLKRYFSLFYYIYKDMFSSQMSSKVVFQHFTVLYEN